MKKTSFASDILGALSGSAVILPQSMGLGVVLFLVMGLDASTGALAGVVGAAILSIVSGLSGSTIGMLSAPNGPVTMLLVGIFTSMANQGSSSDEMLATLSVILILTGLLQIFFSLIGGAQLVKYIPYPVIIGLVTGIGFLMIKSQLFFIISAYETIDDKLIASTPLFVTAITIFAIYITSKKFKKIPAALVGLVIGSIVYQIINYFFLYGAHSSWVVGVVPSIESLHVGISLEALEHIDIELVLGASLALMILATTDCLVTAIVADSQTNLRHDGKKEIIFQGLSQIIIGFFGGLGGGGTKGATLVNLQSGGGRWSAVFSGLTFIFLILFFGALGAYLPIAVLAGVIIFVGFNMMDINMLHWLRYKKSRNDAYIALIVLATIIFVDLVSAVGVGVLISMLMYIHMQIKAPIIHRYTDAIHRRSLSVRTDEESEILIEFGESIVMFELRGNLFFATADKLLSMLDAYIKKDQMVILHFQRVQLIDLSGVMLLLQVASRFKSVGGELLLCHMHKELGIGRKINRALERIDQKHSLKIHTFVDTDTAFEYAENKLLEIHGIKAIDETHYLHVKENELCRSMNSSSIEMIESISIKHDINRGDTLFKQGDEGNSLYMLLQGEIEIRLYTSKSEYKRFAKYSAGTYFGEIAFVNPGKRVASAIANHDSVVLELRQDALLSLEGKAKEELALALLFELGSTLSSELRRSAQEIRRLEQV